MALAELAAYTSAFTTSSGIAAGFARAQTGEPNPVQELAGHAYPPPVAPSLARGMWIATDDEPRRVESWTPLTRIPEGWHVITAAEAQAVLRAGPVSISFTSSGLPTDRESQVAALTYAGPSPGAVRDRRQPRAPRDPRVPRTPRDPRTAREPRPGRAARAPRPRRPGRKPRPPRRPRLPRPPRPRNRKTKEPPGVCKGPACNCWTPAGCIGHWYIEMLPAFAASDCYKGPCYDYGACVTERCNLHVDCLAQTIFQFWARTYRAFAANPLEVIAEAGRGVAFAARHTLRVSEQTLAQFELIAPSVDGITQGCPPGTRWAWGLTGLSCQSPATHPRAATREELIQYGILPG